MGLSGILLGGYLGGVWVCLHVDVWPISTDLVE